MNSNIQDLGGAARFICCNVKVMNRPVKWARILAHLKFLKCKIALLQETPHLLLKDQVRFFFLIHDICLRAQTTFMNEITNHAARI